MFLRKLFNVKKIDLNIETRKFVSMNDIEQEYQNCFLEEIAEIKRKNVKFVRVESNYWEGFVQKQIISIFNKKENIPNIKFQAKQHYIGFWQVWYYNTNELVFDYEFKSLEDIVHLIDFNIRLGIKY